jgi:hypothetical protein
MLSELQTALPLNACVEESLKVPVALYTVRAPVGMVTPVGLTRIETIVALVTVNGEVALTKPSVAVTFTRPGAIALAHPTIDPKFRIDVSEDDQVTTPVRSWLLPSLKVPMAVKAC